MIVEFADGRTGGVYARDRGDFRNPFRPKWKSDWEVKVLDRKQSGWTETKAAGCIMKMRKGNRLEINS